MEVIRYHIVIGCGCLLLSLAICAPLVGADRGRAPAPLREPASSVAVTERAAVVGYVAQRPTPENGEPAADLANRIGSSPGATVSQVLADRAHRSRERNHAAKTISEPIESIRAASLPNISGNRRITEPVTASLLREPQAHHAMSPAHHATSPAHHATSPAHHATSPAHHATSPAATEPVTQSAPAAITEAVSQSTPVVTELPSIIDSTTDRHLAQQAERQLQEARQLLFHNSLHAARQSAIAALQSLAEAHDLRQRAHGKPANEHIRALRSALVAIDESKDFLGRFGDADSESLRRFIRAHETSVLKGRSADLLLPRYAADVYLDLAREWLIASQGKHPSGAEGLSILAATYRAQAQEESRFTEMQSMVAVTLLRAAFACDSDNGEISNELGYMLLTRGLLDEAAWVLEQSVAAHATASAWINLAEVYRQQGRIDGARRCLDRAARIEQSPQNTVPHVALLSVGEFASTGRPLLPINANAHPANSPRVATLRGAQ